jgi:hypothetical protein
MGLAGVEAEALFLPVHATAAAVIAACLRNMRRSIIDLQGDRIMIRFTEVILAQNERGQGVFL